MNMYLETGARTITRQEKHLNRFRHRLQTHVCTLCVISLGVLPIVHRRKIGYQNNERLIVYHLYWCDTKTEYEKAVSYARVSYSLGRFPFTSRTHLSSVFYKY